MDEKWCFLPWRHWKKFDDRDRLLPRPICHQMGVALGQHYGVSRCKLDRFLVGSAYEASPIDNDMENNELPRARNEHRGDFLRRRAHDAPRRVVLGEKKQRSRTGPIEPSVRKDIRIDRTGRAESREGGGKYR